MAFSNLSLSSFELGGPPQYSGNPSVLEQDNHTLIQIVLDDISLSNEDPSRFGSKK